MATAPVSAPADSQVMLDAEHLQLRARRAANKAAGVHGPAPEDPWLGLALSGGGIRSATFNLGILQGLARHGLLPYIDYLSTVSGGGYIGSWLHALIHRYGLDQTEKFLSRPDRQPHDQAGDDPILFLRKYSSYLAPTMGLFSADFWVIFVIWIRNMLLNQLILVPFLALMLLAALHVGFLWHAAAHALAAMPGAATASLAAAALLAAAGAVLAGRGVHSTLDRDQTPSPGPLDSARAGAACAALLLAASAIVAACANALRAQPWGLAGWLAGFAALAFLLQWQGGFLECYARRHGGHRAAGAAFLVLFPLVAGAATALLLWAAARWMSAWPVDATGKWHLTAWGPPLVMLVVLVGVGLHLGLMGADFPDLCREWVSRVAALAALAAFAWAAWYALAVFGPDWIAALAQRYRKTVMGLAAGWLGSLAGSVLSGKSGRTSGEPGAKGNSPALEWAVKLAPPVALAGLLLLISYGVHRAIGWGIPDAASVWRHAAVAALACLAVVALLPLRVNINEFSMHHFYKNRLVRCYLGAARGKNRRPSRFTGFDPDDDFPLANLGVAGNPYSGPYPILNAAVNLDRGSELAKQERKASSFIFTPLYSGYEPPHSPEDLRAIAKGKLARDGYRFTRGYSERNGPALGACLATSGAAANPNMGFHTAAAPAFLMTLFDVRLGKWLGNTRLAGPSSRPGPHYAFLSLLSELFAQTDPRARYLNLSDGGHFENLGLYELVRRRCPFIIAGDGEQDNDLTFGSLGAAIRKCRTDFGVNIRIDPRRIQRVNGFSGTHCVVGKIEYDPDTVGWLLYLKASLTGDEPADVTEYHADHPDFPHQTTANQFFTESQFESYRALGLHILEAAFENMRVDAKTGPCSLANLFECLYEQWYPPTEVADGVGSHHADAYSALMKRLNDDPDLRCLDDQIFCPSSSPTCPPAAAPPMTPAVDRKAFFFCLELIQLMENVWSDLHLYNAEDRGSPRNAGWILVFRHWARQPIFQSTWDKAGYTFNPLFQQFFTTMASTPPPRKIATPCGQLPWP